MKDSGKLIELPENLPAIDLEGAKGFPDLSLRDRQIGLMLATRSIHKKTMKEIAEDFGINRQRLYKIADRKDTKLFVKHIEERMFEELFGLAVIELKDIMEHEKSRSVKLKAVSLIMQASGRMKQEHIHELKQPMKSLDELEREVIELEEDVLDMDA